jgi:carotenoid cleavage dioxygenase
MTDTTLHMDVSEALTPGTAELYFGTGQFFQKDNYAPVTEELTESSLPVEGTIPAELDGWYLRNGPNPREAREHWFSGDGMVHGVRIEKGRAAWYRNRWVRTESFENYFPLYNSDGTRNLRAGLANTHVVNHAGKTLALFELALPHQISNDLETIGVYDFNGKLANSMTAHPKICPTTGELHFFGYGSLTQPHVTYHRADANGELTISRPLNVKALTMMHDMALTAGHVIFMDLPLVFNRDIAARGGSDIPYRWDDNYGARLGILRRDDPYGEMRWFEIDPCYVFHTVNAYDDGQTIVVQAVRYPEVWRSSGGFDTNGVVWSWTIDLSSGRVTDRQLDERPVEFPRIDDRLTSLPARYAVSAGTEQLIRYDLTTGSAVEHAFGTAESPGRPGEAVFVPSSNGPADEGNGWYLAYVYDPARDGSDLVIIDASDFSGRPVARIQLPQRVPFGFHGNWMPAAA